MRLISPAGWRGLPALGRRGLPAIARHDQEVTISAVVFDLDGVVRHWDPSLTEEIEARHGLGEGSIMATAFGPELGEKVVTGVLTYEDWLTEVGDRVGSPAAMLDWSEDRGVVDPDAVALVDELRSAGFTVGLLSNATTRLEEDLEVLGLAPHFDHIFNTARLGVCKPGREVYARVLQLLDLPGEEVVFTDDRPGWAEAAGAVGMHGLHFAGVPGLRADLRQLGLDVAP